MKAKESELNVALLSTIGVFAVFALAIVWGGFWVGLTLSVLWGWFAVPLFGLPVLTVWQAYGLALICFTLRQHRHKKTDDSFGVAIGKALIASPLLCGVMLGVGWGVKTWA